MYKFVINLVLSVCFVLLGLSSECYSQQTYDVIVPNSNLSDAIIYKSKIVSIVHIDLSLKPDFKTETVAGQSLFTFTPYYFNVINSLELDAKEMDIKEVYLCDSKKQKTKKLEYTYDNKNLNIKFEKYYSNQDTITVFIDYVANPKRVKSFFSKVINDNKGVYFINSDMSEENKTTQIWTQGEPENNSVWCPNIEQASQKFSHSINITVPNEFKTISNGVLAEQIHLNDSLRTDYWEFSQLNSPYLMFFAVGKWVEIKDSYKNIPIYYYVDKEHENIGKKIFDKTPLIMEFYENIFRVPYAWKQYSQVILSVIA